MNHEYDLAIKKKREKRRRTIDTHRNLDGSLESYAEWKKHKILKGCVLTV